MSAAAIENIWRDAFAAARLIDETANQRVDARAKRIFGPNAATCLQNEVIYINIKRIWLNAYDDKMRIFRNAWNEVALLRLKQ